MCGAQQEAVQEGRALSKDEACLAAKQLAREIGEEEWRQGKTKFACDALKASDITAQELLQMAQNSLAATDMFRNWSEARSAAFQLSKDGHQGSGECSCMQCRVGREVTEKYQKQITELLCWNIDVEIYDPNARDGFGQAINDCRSTAVACLKTIKQMFP